MADTIKKLKRNRAPHRSLLTKAQKALEEQCNKDIIDEQELGLKISQVEIKEKKVEEFNELILETMYELEDCEEQNIQAEIEKELEEDDSIRESVQRILLKAKSLTTKEADKTCVTQEYEINSDDNPATKAPVFTLPTNLPKLEIQKFDGDPLLWDKFWESFEAAIDKNDALRSVQKFTYLQSFLKGEAEHALEGLTLSSDNYETAKQILKDRFGDEQVIIAVYSQKIVQAAPVNRSNDVIGLRSLYDVCNSGIRSLENLKKRKGETTDYDVLMTVILGKWPIDIVTMWERETQPNTGVTKTLPNLLAFLDREIKSRETSLRLKQQEKQPWKENYQSSSFDKKSYQKKTTTSSLHINAAKYIKPEARKFCICCKKDNHNLEACFHAKKLEPPQIVEMLKNNGRCFKCLEKGHMGKNCPRPKTCTICSRNHPRILCLNRGAHAAKTSSSDSIKKAEVTTTGVTHKSRCSSVLLQTITAKLVTENREITIRCLLDTGSQISFVTDEVVEKMNLTIKERQLLNIQTVGGKKHEEGIRPTVTFALQNVKEPSQAITVEAVAISKICSPISQVVEGAWTKELERKNIHISDIEEKSVKDTSRIDVLIGADYYWHIVSGNIYRTKAGPVAIHTRLGWVLHGPIHSPSRENKTVLSTIMHMNVEMEDVDDVMRKFWMLETLGIESPTQSVINNNSKEAFLSQFVDGIQREEDGRYVVRLPWRKEGVELHNNKNRAAARLHSLVKRLEKSGNLEAYADVLEEQVKNGIAEICEDEIEKSHYLPHREVIRVDHATTKLRVVYDASCKTKDGVSLNDCLETGPKMNPDIFDMFLNLRLGEILILSDIEKAFLQIKLHKDDRNYVRFLWFTDTSDDSRRETKMFRMTRVLFGLNSSPFLLAATLRHHVEQYKEAYPETVKKMKSSLYVDDWAISVNDKEEALKCYEEGKQILEEAKFNLRKWKTSDSSLQEELNRREDVIYEEEQSHQKLLGLQYNQSTDEIVFNLEEIAKKNKKGVNTKRNYLKVSASIYDPLGLISPITTNVKLLIQKLWQLGVSWDEEVPAEVIKRWEDWITELLTSREITFRRWVGRRIQDRLELIMFCDASESAYAAVAYLKVIKENGQVITTLLSSKSRVAPLKKLSLPRLELMAMILSVRLAAAIIKSYQDSDDLALSVKYYSDSMVALAWVKGDHRRWKPFVSNRVVEIQEKSSPQEWRYCKSEDNPADLPSRGTSIKVLNEKRSLWENGPSWLMNNCEVEEATIDEIEVEKESRKNFKVCTTFEREEEQAIMNLEEIQKYNSLDKLLRVTSYVKRFIHNLQSLAESRLKGEITTEEMQSAENYWLKTIQRGAFTSEIEDLQARKKISKKSKIFNLNPKLEEDGLLRIEGRLHWANITSTRKHPIIVPGNSHIIELWIKRLHHTLYHAGLRDTLVASRQYLWIVRGRQVIKKIINDCMNCKKLKTKPYNQVMAPLPEDRLTEAPAFHVTGIDFLGPLFVKTENQEKSQEEKVYVCLMTCAVSRAIHLEVVDNLSTHSFLLALNRFISRRGLPHIIYSDNATTFKKAKKYIEAIWQNLENDKIQDYMATRRIKWKNIVEAAPWWGGFWERLVRTVKDHLKRTLQNALLTIEELSTAIVEIEAVINSRPLTYIYKEHEEPEPITPNLLLTGRLTNFLPSTVNVEEPLSNDETMNRRIAYRESLVEMFWRRWRTEYLQELTKGSKKFVERHTPRVGDICLMEGNQPRLKWKLAKITKLFIGPDGKARAAEIKTKNGSFKRPIKKLYPLEVSQHVEKNCSDNLQETPSIPMVEAHTTEGTRDANPAEEDTDGSAVRHSFGEGGEDVVTSKRVKKRSSKLKDFVLNLVSIFYLNLI